MKALFRQAALSLKSGRCTGHYALRRSGIPCGTLCADAVAWDLAGSLHRAARLHALAAKTDWEPAFNSAWTKLCKLSGLDTAKLVVWSDRAKREQLLSLLATASGDLPAASPARPSITADLLL